MTTFNLVALAVLGIVGTGAYRMHLWLSRLLAYLLSPLLSRHISFVLLVVAGVALAYPFLVPQDTILQYFVWGVYLALAAVGAWHIFDCFYGLRNKLPKIDS